MCTHEHTHIRSYDYKRKQSIHTHTHTHMHTYTRTSTRTSTHTHTHTLHIDIKTKHTYPHTHTHTHVHTHVHTHIHTSTHTHTHTLHIDIKTNIHVHTGAAEDLVRRTHDFQEHPMDLELPPFDIFGELEGEENRRDSLPTPSARNMPLLPERTTIAASSRTPSANRALPLALRKRKIAPKSAPGPAAKTRRLVADSPAGRRKSLEHGSSPLTRSSRRASLSPQIAPASAADRTTRSRRARIDITADDAAPSTRRSKRLKLL
jgi:hypothetical protein